MPATLRRFVSGVAVLAALFSSLGAGRAQAQSSPPPLAATIAADVRAYLAKTGTPGVAVAVYDPKQFGPTGAVYPFGVTALHGTTQVTAETVFQIGSVTKVFTGTMLGVAVARGYAAPTTTAYAAMKSPPKLANAPVFTTITLQQLATHTAGFPDSVKHGDGKNLFNDNPTPPPDLVNFWLTDPAYPGVCYSYSDAGFVTLGYALVDLWPGANNGKYTKILATEIAKPLGMTCTGTGTQQLPSNCIPATGANLAKKPPVAVVGTAADIKSSGAGMLQFLAANLGAGPVNAHPILRKAIATAQTIVGTFPNCSGPGGITLGYAWQVAVAPGGGKVLSKNGAVPVGGMSAEVQMVPSAQIGVVVLTNGIGGKPSPVALAKQLLAAIQAAHAGRRSLSRDAEIPSAVFKAKVLRKN